MTPSSCQLRLSLSHTCDVALAGLAGVHHHFHLRLLRGPVPGGARKQRAGGLGQGCGLGVRGRMVEGARRAGGVRRARALQGRVPGLAGVVVVSVVGVRQSSHLQRAQEPLRQTWREERL